MSQIFETLRFEGCESNPIDGGFRLRFAVHLSLVSGEKEQLAKGDIVSKKTYGPVDYLHIRKPAVIVLVPFDKIEKLTILDKVAFSAEVD